MPITDEMWPRLIILQPEIEAMQIDAPDASDDFDNLTKEDELVSIKKWLNDNNVKFHPRTGLEKLKKLKAQNE